MKHSRTGLTLLVLILLLSLPLSLLAGESDQLNKRMWWEEESYSEAPGGFLRNGFYAANGATGSALGWEFGGGFNIPDVGYIGMQIGFESGDMEEGIRDEGYSQPTPFGLILGHQFNQENGGAILVDLFLAQDFHFGFDYSGRKTYWQVQPTLAYGLPLNRSEASSRLYAPIHVFASRVYMFGGARFMPYGTDVLIGLRFQ